MEAENPLIELVKEMARRRARLDANPPTPANDDQKKEDEARKK